MDKEKDNRRFSWKSGDSADETHISFSLRSFKEFKKSYLRRHKRTNDGSSPDSTASTNSYVKWSDMYFGVSPTGPNYVPPLDLSFIDNTTSEEPSPCSLKINKNPDEAYLSWLEAKQMLRLEKQQRAKEERKRLQQEAEERKYKAQKSFEKWCEKKKREAEQKRLENQMNKAALNASAMVKRQRAPELVKDVVDQWLRQKDLNMERQRFMQLQAEVDKLADKETRKLQAESAWNKWISNVADKPKPVPMNQGFDSLRGTISPLYVNPVPWKGLLPKSKK